MATVWILLLLAPASSGYARPVVVTEYPSAETCSVSGEALVASLNTNHRTKYSQFQCVKRPGVQP